MFKLQANDDGEFVFPDYGKIHISMIISSYLGRQISVEDIFKWNNSNISMFGYKLYIDPNDLDIVKTKYEEDIHKILNYIRTIQINPNTLCPQFIHLYRVEDLEQLQFSDDKDFDTIGALKLFFYEFKPSIGGFKFEGGIDKVFVKFFNEKSINTITLEIEDSIIPFQLVAVISGFLNIFNYLHMKSLISHEQYKVVVKTGTENVDFSYSIAGRYPFGYVDKDTYVEMYPIHRVKNSQDKLLSLSDFVTTKFNLSSQDISKKLINEKKQLFTSAFDGMKNKCIALFKIKIVQSKVVCTVVDKWIACSFGCQGIEQMRKFKAYLESVESESYDKLRSVEKISTFPNLVKFIISCEQSTISMLVDPNNDLSIEIGRRNFEIIDGLKLLKIEDSLKYKKSYNFYKKGFNSNSFQPLDVNVKQLNQFIRNQELSKELLSLPKQSPINDFILCAAIVEHTLVDKTCNKQIISSCQQNCSSTKTYDNKNDESKKISIENRQNVLSIPIALCSYTELLSEKRMKLFRSMNEPTINKYGFPYRSSINGIFHFVKKLCYEIIESLECDELYDLYDSTINMIYINSKDLHKFTNDVYQTNFGCAMIKEISETSFMPYIMLFGVLEFISTIIVAGNKGHIKNKDYFDYFLKNIDLSLIKLLSIPFAVNHFNSFASLECVISNAYLSLHLEGDISAPKSTDLGECMKMIFDQISPISNFDKALEEYISFKKNLCTRDIKDLFKPTMKTIVVAQNNIAEEQSSIINLYLSRDRCKIMQLIQSQTLSELQQTKIALAINPIEIDFSQIKPYVDIGSTLDKEIDRILEICKAKAKFIQAICIIQMGKQGLLIDELFNQHGSRLTTSNRLIFSYMCESPFYKCNNKEFTTLSNFSVDLCDAIITKLVIMRDFTNSIPKWANNILNACNKYLPNINTILSKIPINLKEKVETALLNKQSIIESYIYDLIYPVVQIIGYDIVKICDLSIPIIKKMVGDKEVTINAPRGQIKFKVGESCMDVKGLFNSEKRYPFQVREREIVDFVTKHPDIIDTLQSNWLIISTKPIETLKVAATQSLLCGKDEPLLKAIAQLENRDILSRCSSLVISTNPPNIETYKISNSILKLVSYISNDIHDGMIDLFGVSNSYIEFITSLSAITYNGKLYANATKDEIEKRYKLMKNISSSLYADKLY